MGLPVSAVIVMVIMVIAVVSMVIMAVPMVIPVSVAMMEGVIIPVTSAVGAAGPLAFLEEAFVVFRHMRSSFFIYIMQPEGQR